VSNGRTPEGCQTGASFRSGCDPSGIEMETLSVPEGSVAARGAPSPSGKWLSCLRHGAGRRTYLERRSVLRRPRWGEASPPSRLRESPQSAEVWLFSRNGRSTQSLQSVPIHALSEVASSMDRRNFPNYQTVPRECGLSGCSARPQSKLDHHLTTAATPPPHAPTSIRSGFSMHSFTRTRKVTASLPSTMRWS